MFLKKLSLFALPFVLLFTFSANSQVITSKKEAVKKGVYQKPVEKSKSELTEKKVATITKSSKNSKVKKAVINDSDDKEIIPAKENYIALQMINNAMTFIGVRYSGGGTTKAGMDCSGMVTAVCDIFDMKLPRSSNEMAKVGTKVDHDDIQKGDLIFFKTNGKSIINHVGMVIDVIGDEIKFVHSSTSKGVIVSSTKEAYYSKRFAQANRIL